MLDDAHIERFWSKVDHSNQGGCWPWLGSTMWQGYGRFSVFRKMMRAHRVSFILAHGEIPEGKVIDHICRNRLCVNPTHLRAVSQRENVLENSISEVAKRARQTHCKHGHPLSDKNLYVYRGFRQCLACKAERTRKDRAAIRALKGKPTPEGEGGEVA